MVGPVNRPFSSDERRPLFDARQALFMVVEFGLNPVEAFDDFIETAIDSLFEIVKPLVLHPLRYPYGRDESDHERQCHLKERLLKDGWIHAFLFYPVMGSVSPG
jgi:hypothetical protein